MHYIFTVDEAVCIENALDLYSRIWIGQYDHIDFDLRWKKNCTVLDRYEKTIQAEFIKLREILMPELINYGYYGSHGIFSSERDFRAGVSYDIIQEMRYRIAWFEHPEGGNTVDFGRPLRCEDDPYPPIDASCSKKDGKTILDMDAVSDQAEIMLTALNVKDAENHFDIRKMFSFYTDNVLALSCAERLTQIYAEIPDDERFKRDFPVMNALITLMETSLRQDTKGHGRIFLRCPFADADVMISDMAEHADKAICPVCKREHFLPHDDESRKRIWHRNRNMFMRVPNDINSE